VLFFSPAIAIPPGERPAANILLPVASRVVGCELWTVGRLATHQKGARKGARLDE